MPNRLPVSERFSLGHWSWHELIRNEFPSVSADRLFGEVTRSCWHGNYGPIATIEQDTLSWRGRGLIARHWPFGSTSDIFGPYLLPNRPTECPFPLSHASCTTHDSAHSHDQRSGYLSKRHSSTEGRLFCR